LFPFFSISMVSLTQK